MKKTYEHTMDALFPIALFFVFTATALVALLLAANLYQKQIDRSSAGFRQNTSLSYLTEKIRQNDEGGAKNIHIEPFDGHDALKIIQEYGGSSYTTYIYVMDGFLTELFVPTGTDISSQSGTRILEVDTLEMTELESGLFQFTCTSDNGETDSAIVSVHSR